jgi:MFS family permease
VARGATPLTAGLLMAPQGLGAAVAMPIAGRLTDRLGGGRVALVGTVVVALATIPFATVSAHTSYALLGVVLFVRGVGMGSAMMPSMAAAFAVLSPAQVPRATSALNTIQRVGGAVGTALMAVVLEHQLSPVLSGSSSGGAALESASGGAGAGAASDLATAFGHTFWWAIGLSVLAIIPAAILAITQGREQERATLSPAGAPA